MFASQALGRVFSDRGILGAMLEVEAALAEAEAECGVIPREAAAAIRDACDPGLYDIEAIGRGAALGGNLAIPLVKALTAKVEADHRGYVHWGATSQDVIDTGFMLLARTALAEIGAQTRSAMKAAAALARRHRDAIMPGRTWMQHALPIPFGYKVAVWLSGLAAAHAAVRRVRREALAIQFGGAAGTLAALRSDGLQVRAALARRLSLPEPAVTWHAERSRIFEIAAALGLLSGACAKIALDIQLLMQTEIGEALEPSAPGKGGSSTMPHKRNPVGSAAVRANHRRITGLVATIVSALEQEQERAPGAWPAEWETMRDLFLLAGGSVERTAAMLAGLEVEEGRMRENLDLTLGLPLAESLMMALARDIGRMEAHHRVEAASRTAATKRRPLAEIARSDPQISDVLGEDEIDAALDPSNYLGSAAAMIERALTEAERELEAD
ncbi:3-carboxy-cis,cis-muconate cycloisomerase [Rhizobiales bacterium L72]|uniref:3-carboxy-cis,cis-muconate cycloisomerase n=2 Tax=Propylenella binzhouense TaxID=2555902 RepID=A0A964WTA1_9HYPH|nr:3-carboxy-cis,cis-muconate cycloisomerase [Propylenella binzhouense]